MRDISDVTISKGNGKRLSEEAIKMYDKMQRGDGVTDKMKEEWKRKPYYMEVKKK